MKGKLIIILLILSNCCYGQISLSGTLIDSASNHIEPYANAGIYKNDLLISGFQTDMKGHFNINIKEEGYYLIKVNSIYTASSKYLYLKNDTNLLILLIKPLEYNQPCRMIQKQSDCYLDLPNDTEDFKEYKRINNETKKLGLESIPDIKDSLFFRIWLEPAFEYLGGNIFEIINVDKSWHFIRYRYNSNYLKILDSIDKHDIYTLDDSIFDDLLKFKIYQKNEMFPISGWQKFNDENFFGKMLKTEDYCLTMLSGDKHPCTDGIGYHLEIKWNNYYKFISFENPKCVAEYQQVILFLKLLNYIEKEFKD
ncbi:MAG TPA: hypothetical protein PKI01_10580 [Bacteroidales bacterium]|nr:hypothetical protein [Bacteroidales bacterium]